MGGQDDVDWKHQGFTFSVLSDARSVSGDQILSSHYCRFIVIFIFSGNFSGGHVGVGDVW